VAAAFERAGAKVCIFDFVVSEYSQNMLKAWMDAFSPDVVGATSVTMNFPQAAQILCEAKKIAPSVVTMMGGPHVSFHAQQTLEQYRGIDMIVIGEGEKTISELVPRISDPDAWKEVPGIVFRNGGDIIATGRRELIEDLDSLPFPARHLLSLSRYKALGFPVSVITSRGCPNLCIFCLGRRMVGRKVRYRDPGLVLDEIELLIKMGFHTINLADDLFTSNKKRVAQICDEIAKRGLKFEWSAFSRVNTINEETVRMMKEAGCNCISFGIESGNPQMLKRIRKGITLEQARHAAAICKKVGIMAHASFMVGLPGETHETLEDTRRFANSLDIAHGYHFLAPFPGTTVKEQIDEYDLEILTDDWSLYDANQPVVRTSAVSAQDAMDFVGRYMDVCEQEWLRMEQGYDLGTNTSEENFRIEGRRKLDLVFSIVSKDLVGRCGKVPKDLDSNTSAALDILSDKIAHVTGKSKGLAFKVIKYFYMGSNIEIRNGQTEPAWGWTPNPSESFLKKNVTGQEAGASPAEAGEKETC
jgi:radical SAM superfamily enzyme YgiQ (UPF0313 family)